MVCCLLFAFCLFVFCCVCCSSSFVFVKAAELEELDRKLRKRRWYHREDVLWSASVIVLCSCVGVLFCFGVVCLYVRYCCFVFVCVYGVYVCVVVGCFVCSWLLSLSFLNVC